MGRARVERPLGAPRWRGQRGRLEVWYATFTDPGTGFGFWLHHEVVSPSLGAGEPYGLGWAAAFPAGTGERPALHRFGPEPVTPRPPSGEWFDAAGVSVGPESLRGRAGPLSWDLLYADDARPLYTFPRSVWERELLPAAQVVPAPTARFTGQFVVGDETVRLDRARGALARIYGHGNAQRWGWLHAELGGHADGDVLEIVAAVARRPVLRWVPPMAVVQLRLHGVDWPPNQLLAAPRFRADLGLPTWTVRGVSGRRRLVVNVTIPPDRAVALGYVDPDGATATCTNSERADAEIVLDRRAGDEWVEERRWELAGTAHAEIGERP